MHPASVERMCFSLHKHEFNIAGATWECKPGPVFPTQISRFLLHVGLDPGLTGDTLRPSLGSRFRPAIYRILLWGVKWSLGMQCQADLHSHAGQNTFFCLGMYSKFLDVRLKKGVNKSLMYAYVPHVQPSFKV